MDEHRLLEILIRYSPCYKGRGLIFSEVSLPLGIKWRICSITIEKLELDLIIATSLKQRLVDKPIIWTNCLTVSNTMGVLPFCCINSLRFSYCCLIFLAAILPVCFDRYPEIILQPNFIGIVILNDQSFYPIWMFCNNAETYWSTVVL
jgi:hypothetical protein